MDGGLIPNRFPDDSEKPEYNTVDATLWFINAIDRYLAYSGDWPFVAERLFPIIASILDAHEQGTRHQIKADTDGLLAAGEPGVQLTWMDAKFGDWVVTPRIGKPVEINALWYNALRIAADYADRLEQRTQAQRLRGLADRAAASFNARFWNTAVGCCYDVIDCDHVAGRFDPSIRPNQVFATALTHPILERSAPAVDDPRRTAEIAHADRPAHSTPPTPTTSPGTAATCAAATAPTTREPFGRGC